MHFTCCDLLYFKQNVLSGCLYYYCILPHCYLNLFKCISDCIGFRQVHTIVLCVLPVIAVTEFDTRTNLAIAMNLSYMPVMSCMLLRHVLMDGLLELANGHRSLGHFPATTSSE